MKANTYKVIGVMSGTSLDGIDLCEAEFKTERSKWSYKILKASTIPYPEDWEQSLQNAHHLSSDDIGLLDEKYTQYLSEVILDFMTNSDDIDLVCSHGHTIWHEPEKGLTFQLGNLPILADLIHKTVVCDFRVADVALGGQGAPLVPIGDRLLFNDYDYCINIGGFVNISFEAEDSRIAFDICPANKILNYYAKLLGEQYDDKGKIAKSGKCNDNLLNELNAIDFYKQNPPKSLGVEWIEKNMLPILNKYKISHADKLNTLCQHVAFQITKFIKRSSSKVLITGGGAYHDFLIDCIKNKAESATIVIPNNTLIEYKEALIFGLLGILKYRDEVNVLQSVTGARYDHSSGKVIRFEV